MPSRVAFKRVSPFREAEEAWLGMGERVKKAAARDAMRRDTMQPNRNRPPRSVHRFANRFLNIRFPPRLNNAPSPPLLL